MRQKKPLIKNSKLLCPRCKQYHEIFSYIPEMQISEYEHETVPIIKCPSCRWRFALAPNLGV